MGLFSKEACCFCGKEVGLMSRSKLSSGEYICTDCKYKTHPFLRVDHRNKQQVEDLMAEMEELDQFMDEFRNKDIEVIWGIADDESLDENVKITILATGFGISNIPGMEKGLGHPNPTPRQEEPTLPQKEATPTSTSDETQDEDRIIGTYGEAFSTFVFDEKDLDNDVLIAAVANSPTYNRKATDLKNLQGMRTSN